ncbi:MAG: sulfotransferase [Sulfurovum sp.]|nr:sulfotransferase [Sulfurovum sp.]
MKKDYRMPNFLIVGAAKAGTTSIYEYIKNHPEIFLTEPKEPTFFSYADEDKPVFSMHKEVDFVTKIKDYSKLYDSVENQKCWGEASTPYLYLYEKTIDNIKRLVPDYNNLKIIIILRNPVERAYSQYMMRIRDLTEHMSFEDAINDEKNRMENNAHFDFFYLDRGLYYKQVKAYLENFKNVNIILYDDLRKNNADIIKEILTFLRVDEKYIPDIRKEFNVSGKSKIRFLRSLIIDDYIGKNLLKKILPKSIRKKIQEVIDKYNTQKIPMEQKDRDFLKKYYKNDIIKLESLIGRDLSSWYL